MDRLLRAIRDLENSKVRRLVKKRIKEFEANGRKQNTALFKEMCFCILAANFNAERTTQIQRTVGDGFLTLSRPELSRELRELGYRFPNTRASYIFEAQEVKSSLKGILASFDNENAMREWLCENVKGLGYKEASHFLRNIGCKNLAIIDSHIMHLLGDHELIEMPATLTKKRYLEIEEVLRKISQKAGLSLAELDLYLWYMETGKVLK